MGLNFVPQHNQTMIQKMNHWMDCRMFSPKAILMVIEDVISIEKFNYFIIHCSL